MTAIWNGASTTPAATHRVPVDVSSSGGPTRWTGQQIADLRAYVGGTVNNLGSINTNQSLSLADGLYIAATITGNVQFTFTSVPTGFTDLFLELTNAGAHTVSFAATIGWTGGTTPSLPAVGVALIHLYTRDGGTSYIAHLVSDEQQFDAAAIISGTIAAARLPTPTTTALGGVKRNTGSAGQFVTGIDTDGSLLRDTPAGGSPAGSGSELQYRVDATTFGAMSGTAWDDTNRSLTITGATVTTSKPVTSLSQTWNNAGVTFYGQAFNVTNTASASGSLLAYWQVPATNSGCAMRPDGRFLSYSGAAPSSGTSFGQSGGASFLVTEGTTNVLSVSANGVNMRASSVLAWSSSGDANLTSDLVLYRDAANTLAQRNSTNEQTFRVYRSYTDASNYSRWAVKWNTSTAILQAEGAGTGTNGSTAFGNAALATNATVGFLMIPSCAGTPTGTPADIPTGQSPIVYDSTNKKLCVWDGAAWVQTAALT